MHIIDLIFPRQGKNINKKKYNSNLDSPVGDQHNTMNINVLRTIPCSTIIKLLVLIPSGKTHRHSIFVFQQVLCNSSPTKRIFKIIYYDVKLSINFFIDRIICSD